MNSGHIQQFICSSGVTVRRLLKMIAAHSRSYTNAHSYTHSHSCSYLNAHTCSVLTTQSFFFSGVVVIRVETLCFCCLGYSDFLFAQTAHRCVCV